MTKTSLRTQSTANLLAQLTGIALKDAEQALDKAHYDLFALPKQPSVSYAIFCELLNRAVTIPPNRKIEATPANIIRATMPYRAKSDEHIVVVSLNNERPTAGIKAINLASIGTPDGCDFTDHTILRWPIMNAVTDFVIVHTHPNDDAEPSAHDIAYTNTIANHATMLHLRLIDHIIVSNSTWYSMREKGIIG